MKTTQRIDTVTCDGCGKVAVNPRGWLTLRGRLCVQEYGGYGLTNGGMNEAINRRHYDACRRRCAENIRAQLLEIVQERP